MIQKENNTYHRILVAAAGCFSEKGFNATSISDIAQKADVSKGAMYTYFRGKSELITAIVEEEKNTALDSYSKPFRGSAFHRIFDLVCSCINEVGYPADHRLWVEIIAEAARNEEVKNAFINTDKVMRGEIGSVIRAGMLSGEFRDNTDPEEATIAIFALIDGLISRRAINPDFNLAKQLPSLESILRFILGCPVSQ